ncbi:MAG: DUF4248 domain-containing protein [Phocaeicola sp.]|nr:DUF4248 domain-containing protein [Phocaeicola sp.]
MQTLRSWIARNNALWEAQAKTDYNACQVTLMPRQVELIFEYLVEP